MVNPRRPTESDRTSEIKKSRLDDESTKEASSLDLEDDNLDEEPIEDDDDDMRY